jgi:hypothetical protein
VGNVPNLPDHSWVSRIEASRTAAGTAYATFDRHRFGDMKPYVYKTTDFGQTWTSLRANLPEFGYLYVIREDPKNPDLLYLGSEFGIFASFDGGRRWLPIHGDSLPPAAVRDILIHPRDNDLVIGTHGRAIWILDDVTPLQQLSDAVVKKAFLFDSTPATRFTPRFTKPFLADQTFHGESKEVGATISYYLGEEPEENGTVEITIEDSSGDQVRTLEGTKNVGLNRVSWALDYDPLGEEPRRGGGFGPSTPTLRVLPGSYTVRLSALGEEMTRSLEVRLDPELEISTADLEAQHEAAKRLTTMQHEVNQAFDTVTDVKRQLETVNKELEGFSDELTEEGKAIIEKLDEIRLKLVSDPGGYRSPAQLRGKIGSLLGAIGMVSARPTAAQSEWIERFDSELQEIRGVLSGLVDQEVAAFNRRINEAGVPRIAVK